MQTKLLVLDVDGTLTDGGLYLETAPSPTGGCIWIPPATRPRNFP